MSFKPCLLIPIYNHKEAIRDTVSRLLAFEIPIVIVDDGSDQQTQQVLAALVADYPQLQLHRLPENGGKGAAVMHGMRVAFRAGYSHALQIDADGQHDANDVPKFLQSGMQHPDAVICGKPVYDDSVPRARLYGRFITHFWVWVETLSFQIGDSMCGFRLYPLAATCALIDRVRIPTRMDFDIEIAVRLAWEGLPFINLPTRVTYPADGVSHFDMLHDNVRISRMHTRLFFGMLPRLPLLLARMATRRGGTKHHWSRLAERGGGLGLRCVYGCYRLLGDKAARLLLYPVVAYFFLTGKTARTASLQYLQRIHERNRAIKAGWRSSFRHMMAFAESGLDKLIGWMGKMDRQRVHFPQQVEFEALLASGRGAVLIGSHLGNIEMARALASTEKRVVINAVVYTEHAQQFNRVLAQSNPEFGINLIQVSSFGPDTAIMFREKVDRGELLVIVGDRTPPAENGRVTAIPFLGAEAPFAQGPFILASLLDCPVYLLFCLRNREGYRIDFERFADRITLPRAAREQHLRQYLQNYAARLEAKCLEFPYQWFNFYDFWRREPATATL